MNSLHSLRIDTDSSLDVAGEEEDLTQHHVGLLVFAELQGLLETLLGQVPLPEVEVADSQVVGDLPVLLRDISSILTGCL